MPCCAADRVVSAQNWRGLPVFIITKAIWEPWLIQMSWNIAMHLKLETWCSKIKVHDLTASLSWNGQNFCSHGSSSNWNYFLRRQKIGLAKTKPSLGCWLEYHFLTTLDFLFATKNKGGWFNIMMQSYQFRNSHYENEMVILSFQWQ